MSFRTKLIIAAVILLILLVFPAAYFSLNRRPVNPLLISLAGSPPAIPVTSGPPSVIARFRPPLYPQEVLVENTSDATIHFYMNGRIERTDPKLLFIPPQGIQMRDTPLRSMPPAGAVTIPPHGSVRTTMNVTEREILMIKEAADASAFHASYYWVTSGKNWYNEVLTRLGDIVSGRLQFFLPRPMVWHQQIVLSDPPPPP